MTTSIVVTIILSSLFQPLYTYAEPSLKEIRDERSEIKKELTKSEREIGSIISEIKEINTELAILEQSKKENENAMEEVKSEISEVEKEIKQLQERIDERFDILNERAKSLQDSGGNISYLEVLFGSKNFTDFISRLHAITQITDSDAQIIDEQIKEQGKVEQKLDELEDLEAELTEMEQLIAEQQDVAKEMKASLKKQENKLKEKTKKLKEKDRNLARKEADLVVDAKGEIIHTSNSNAILAWPTKGGYISSTFGSRWGRQHKGIDIARTDRSTSPPIIAAESGTVKQTGNKNNGYGNMVVIDHGNGLNTLYAHMSSIDVKVGQKVKRGEKIGVMGSTGNSTGIHLHFEVHENGRPQNPIPYLR